MKKIKFFLFSLYFVCQVKSQVQFINSYIMPVPSFPMIGKTPDGGYLVCNSSNYNDPDKVTYLLKFDARSKLQWQKKIPSFSAGQLHVLKSGKILLSARNQPALLKLDQYGNISWHKQYSSGATYYWGYSCGEFPNGDLFLNGNTQHGESGNNWHGFIIKTDSAGNIKWNKSYGAFGAWGFALACSDGGVLSRAANLSFKTDEDGNLQWSKKFVGCSYSFKPVEVTDGFVFSNYGETGLPDTGFVYKTDKNGNILWAGERFLSNYLTTIKKLPNGNFLSFGSFRVNPAEWRFWPTLAVTDSTGAVLKQVTYPLYKNLNSFQGEDCCLLDNGSLVFTGRGSGLSIAATDRSFLLGCNDSFPQQVFPRPNILAENYPLSPNNYSFQTSAPVLITETVNVEPLSFCNGYTPLKFKLPSFICLDNGTASISGPAGYECLWSNGASTTSITVSTPGTYSLQITDPCTNYTYSAGTIVLNCSDVGVPEPLPAEIFNVYPNPATDKIFIDFEGINDVRISIYNYYGEEVISKNVSHKSEIDLQENPPGIYFLSIQTTGRHHIYKIMKN